MLQAGVAYANHRYIEEANLVDGSILAMVSTCKSLAITSYGTTVAPANRRYSGCLWHPPSEWAFRDRPFCS